MRNSPETSAEALQKTNEHAEKSCPVEEIINKRRKGGDTTFLSYRSVERITAHGVSGVFAKGKGYISDSSENAKAGPAKKGFCDIRSGDGANGGSFITKDSD